MKKVIFTFFHHFLACEDRGRQAVHNHVAQGAVGGVENGHNVSDAVGPAKYADILEAHSTIPGGYTIFTHKQGNMLIF